MVEIKVTGNTPLEALSSLTAFGLHCLSISDTPKAAPAPTEAPGPADGENGQTPAPGDKPEPVPTVEQVRAKGIEASRKYGKDAVVAILQKFGASGMSAIAEKDRAAFLTALEGLGEGDA